MHPQDAVFSSLLPQEAGVNWHRRYAAAITLSKCGAGAPRSRHFPMEFLVFCVFFGEEQTAPLNKVQVWGYSDAVANATAPCWPAMLAKLPNRPCDWKAPQLHCLSDVNPCVKLSRVAI